MLQTCNKCSRANPPEAIYCYFDGLVLGGHARNGGPVAVGAQPFNSPFVFPHGRACRSFDELALACQENWDAARDLLQQGYLESFLGGLGRIDLAMAAKEAARFPDRDRGLDQLLSKLPSDVLDAPKLRLEPQEVNLGVVPVGGGGREFQLRLENQGMRLLYGSLSCADGVWLTLGDAAGAGEKHFQFTHEMVLPVKVAGDRLRANNKPLEARLEVETNGGTAMVLVRAEVPVKPFPGGVLAGAKSPRQAAEKAKAHPKEAALHFEKGEVAAWYKANGWTYPVQGPAASGLSAVQQFFEALGLTPPPKVECNPRSLTLSGDAGATLRAGLELKTEEKKPIYGHAVSDQPWLEVGRTKVSGRTATIGLSVPSVPNKPGQTLTAKVKVQSNGKQRFVVPVTLRVGAGAAEADLPPAGVFNFEDAAPAAVAEPLAELAAVTAAPRVASPVARAPARPASAPRVEAPPSSPYAGRYRRQPGASPLAHLIPAGLLALAVFVVVLVDLIWKPAAATPGGEPRPPDAPPPEFVETKPGEWKYAKLESPDPKLGVQFTKETRHFGLSMLNVPHPRIPGKNKQLTYDALGDPRGATNNTIVKIDESEFRFGETNPTNTWQRVHDVHDEIQLKDRLSDELVKKFGLDANQLKAPVGWVHEMRFGQQNVNVQQHVEVVPGQSGYLDTCLVWYKITNNDTTPHKVGLRFMLDTYIGANDGVPVLIPGKGLDRGPEMIAKKDVPRYFEVVENPDDPKDPGTVAQLYLKDIPVPGIKMDDPESVLLCRYPGKTSQGWDVEEPLEIGDDSSVFIYWPYVDMKPHAERNMAFTYGLGRVEITAGSEGRGVALSAPSPVVRDTEFVVTAYVYNASKGDDVELHLPGRGLTLAGGESAVKKVEEGGKRSTVSWRVRAGEPGSYSLQASFGKVKTKPYEVVVKSTSIFG
jgi:hypothetical protein